jgi:hypothetical protein
MANIQMEYRVYSCELDQENFCEQCLTDAASDMGCFGFCDGNDNRIGSGSCIHANIRTAYKGITTKKYEAEVIYDPYEPDEYMSVKIGGKYYECDKVILDGVQIYPDEEAK